MRALILGPVKLGRGARQRLVGEGQVRDLPTHDERLRSEKEKPTKREAEGDALWGDVLNHAVGT